MKIAVDAMGGDNAPGEIVKGALAAAREHDLGIILVGPQDRLQRELAANDATGLDIEIVHTDEYLVEGEHPAYALRQKRNASVAVAVKMVKKGRAAAAVSAGSTGGVVAAGLQILGTVEGIARPVVGGNFLGFAPQMVVMDMGGNVDCRPDQLLDFAIVGRVYAQKLLKVADPTVALLSTGAEEGKGNSQVRESYELFKKAGINFIGNVEGIDIPAGKANVIICDGFVGNVMVKFTEAMGEVVGGWLAGKLAGKVPESDIDDIRAELRRATNTADTLGGGPIWAVDGVVIVAHGRSKAPAIAGAIGQAKSVVEVDLIGSLKEELVAARRKLKESVGV
ncbi:phosphate acyltransferase PlsX [Chloroflexota bacterium]